MQPIIDRLCALHACPESIKWLQTQPDAATAWEACERGDWMLWIAGRVSGERGSPAHRAVVLAACGCARIALLKWTARYPEDGRPLKAIETTEAWARGDASATLDDVRRARSAAYAAAADAAYADAAYAAYAAADADAAAAAYAAYAAYAAADARTSTLKACADIVRRHIPTPPVIA